MRKQFYFQILFAGLLIHLFFLAFAFSSLEASFEKSTRWRYIIIHHSGTEIGSLDIFDRYHRNRGMKNGAAYHFIIDNGTAKRGDGQIEVTNRWKRQIEGGHCRQRWINRTGIGICLVGNFEKTKPTRKQMDALVSLIRLIRSRYYIPLSNIEGHGGMKGEKTECPGKNFSMKNLRNMLLKEEDTMFHIPRPDKK